MASPHAPVSSRTFDPAGLPTLGGHPTGLFTLFFAEMWERFSYYGMRALLVFYMIKGFLGYGDGEAYKVYGAYVAMVYMTPFFGGMLADRLLGARRAVIFGGMLMAAGHLLMTVQTSVMFYLALALLIVGNGFFKPNISTIVGSLYTEDDPRRDGGFTLFYMGINLGAAMAPLLCGYVGETYGWHYGFGLATVGMLIGLAVFVVPTRLAQALILGGALLTAVGQVAIQDNTLLLLVNGFVALALVVSGVAAFAALQRGGIPIEAGQPPDLERLNRPLLGPITNEVAVYLGTLIAVPAFALLVWSNRSITVFPEALFKPMLDSTSAFLRVAGVLMHEMSTVPGLLVVVTGLGGFAFLLWESFRSEKIERERLWVITVLMVFSMLFWAFFEQAGSSVNNFTDRNVDRVIQADVITPDQVGTSLDLTLSQAQLGYRNPAPEMRAQVAEALRQLDAKKETPSAPEELDALVAWVEAQPGLTLTALDALREAKATTVRWQVAPEHVGMSVGGAEIPATTYQSANPIFILIFGLVFTGLWGFLGRRGLEPSTPVKFSLGLLQLGLGFVALWYGAEHADSRGMVAMSYLLLGYLLHTTGELCLSPVGLSMITRLSPARLVSTAMGAWFLATALSSLLSGIIATFTVSSDADGELLGVPVPTETVGIYGEVFFTIAAAALVSAVIAFALSPWLKRWMHEEAMRHADEPAA